MRMLLKARQKETEALELLKQSIEGTGRVRALDVQIARMVRYIDARMHTERVRHRLRTSAYYESMRLRRRSHERARGKGVATK